MFWFIVIILVIFLMFRCSFGFFIYFNFDLKVVSFFVLIYMLELFMYVDEDVFISIWFGWVEVFFIVCIGIVFIWNVIVGLVSEIEIIGYVLGFVYLEFVIVC